MKSSKFFKFSSLLLLQSFLTIGAISFSSANAVETEAYTPASLKTKNITLKDNSDSEIRNYYKALNSLADSELKGTNLLKNLKPILSNNQNYYKYDGSDAHWRMYEIVDRDWEKSPASEIPGYDASTNTINSYTYKSALNPYVHALYVNRDVENPKQAWGDHGGNNSRNVESIEREHIWPKSHGFNNEAEASGGARGDPMHLWPADGHTNGVHNNNYYGNVDKTKTYTDCSQKYTFLKGNYLGISKTVGSGKVFEPQDCDKGDIARAVFYMVARYNNYAGSTTEVFNSDNPNLKLDDDINTQSTTSDGTNAIGLGVLTDLLEWNKLDPVDEFEKHRNNLLFNNYTNNRNPFIDFPDWADIVWGDSTSAAHPATDQISESSHKEEAGGQLKKVNSLNGGEDVAFVCESNRAELTSISTGSNIHGVPTTYGNELSGEYLFKVVKNGDYTFSFLNDNKYLCYPSSGGVLSLDTSINDNSKWNVSFDESSNAIVTNVAEPTRTIQYNNTATRFGCYSGSFKPIQIYKVDDYVPVTGISLNKTSINMYVGETISLEATISPSNATNKKVNWLSLSTDFISYNQNGEIRALKATGANKVGFFAISDDNPDIQTYCMVEITYKPSATRIEVSGNFKTFYKKGEDLDLEDLVVTAFYDDGSSKNITEESSIDYIDLDTYGEKTVRVYGEGCIAEVKFYVYKDLIEFRDFYTVPEDKTNVEATTINYGDYTISFEKNGNKSGNAPKFYPNAVRMYAKNQMKVESIHKLKNIFLGFDSSDPKDNEITASNGTFDDFIWSGDTQSVIFEEGGTSGQRRINRVYLVGSAQDATLTKLAVTGTCKTKYAFYDTLDLSGLSFSAEYSDDTSVQLTLNDIDVSCPAFTSEGEKDVTLSYTDKGVTKSHTFKINVKERIVDHLTVKNIKTEFEYIEDFSLGENCSIVAYFTNDTFEDVTSKVQVSQFPKSSPGKHKMTITYDDAMYEYYINIAYSKMVSLTVTKKTDEIRIKYGKDFDKNSVQVVVTYDSGLTKDVTKLATYTGLVKTSLGEQIITVKYTENGITLTGEFKVTVYDIEQSISVSGIYKVSYSLGEEFDPTGLKVLLYYESGQTKDVTSEATITGFESESVGKKTLTVSYNNLTTSIFVYISDPNNQESSFNTMGMLEKIGVGGGVAAGAIVVISIVLKSIKRKRH